MDSTTHTVTNKTSIEQWAACKNILVIRADNLGDLIMSSPAIRALKQTFNAKITVLTSQMATGIAGFIQEVDEVITYDLPWIKTNNAIASNSFFKVVNKLKEKQFDAAVIFTVFSQNPLPAAMLAYLANIPLRLAYCRENPYDLLTHWMPDKEPYSYIRHQVERDLLLVESVGAVTTNQQLQLSRSEDAWIRAEHKLLSAGICLADKWIIFHAPVSEPKREYPADNWIEAGKLLCSRGYSILLTGTNNEKALTDNIANAIGQGAFSIAGLLTLEEFIALVAKAPVVASVNTGTVHIAAAVATPVVVLYANTNPQHTPWKVPSKILYYDIAEEARSKNEVIQFLYRDVYSNKVAMPQPVDIVAACLGLLQAKQGMQK